METLSVTLLQFDISWENVDGNLRLISQQISELKGRTDLVVLPEMFSTGFTMNPEQFAEDTSDATITRLKLLSRETYIAITGSFASKDGGRFYNRGFFITPEGELTIYDKRHLFRMGDEPMHYCGGESRPIIRYKEWNICLLICYDLRFPVWSRNCNNEYDLLLYVANWPSARAKVWDVLLKARAIENMAYVCGVNRIGTDGLGIFYLGGSVMINPKGEEISRTNDKQLIETVNISFDQLYSLREKFPTWKDADIFEIKL